MPKSRQTSVIASPSISRATKRRRSSITELAFHGINTSRPQTAKSVTHVSGTECHLCLGPLKTGNAKTRRSCARSADERAQQYAFGAHDANFLRIDFDARASTRRWSRRKTRIGAVSSDAFVRFGGR